MQQIIQLKLSALKEHPKNVAIFGDPKNSAEYQAILKSIQDGGIQEPIIVLPDGTILSGHLRAHAMLDIARERGQSLDEVEIPARIHEAFEAEYQELHYIFEANARRRHLTPRQLATSFSLYMENLPPRGKASDIALRRKPNRNRRQSYKELFGNQFRISEQTVDKINTIFNMPGVPENVKDRVDRKEITLALAYEAVQFAIEEARRREPDLKVNVVDPIDVTTYLDVPPVARRAFHLRLEELIRNKNAPKAAAGNKHNKAPFKRGGKKPPAIPKALKPVSTLMKLGGKSVRPGEMELSRLAPLHISLAKIHNHLVFVLEHKVLVKDALVTEILQALILRAQAFLNEISPVEIQELSVEMPLYALVELEEAAGTLIHHLIEVKKRKMKRVKDAKSIGETEVKTLLGLFEEIQKEPA